MLAFMAQLFYYIKICWLLWLNFFYQKQPYINNKIRYKDIYTKLYK